MQYRDTLTAIYRDYVNDYLTVETFAEHNGLTDDEAKALIDLARSVAFKNLYEFFGWKGGTIHQIVDATGVDADTLLSPAQEGVTKDASTKYSAGGDWKTCALQWRLDVLAPTYRGDADYWLGVRDSKCASTVD